MNTLKSNTFRIMNGTLRLCAALTLVSGAAAFAQDQTNTTPPAPRTVRDVEGLHPALRQSPQEVEKAVQRGQELARKSASSWDIYRKFQRRPHWLRRRGGTSGEYVLCMGLEATHITRQVYEAARKYEDPHLPQPWLSTGTYTSDLAFQVKLVSAPEFGYTTDATIHNLFEALANLSHPSPQNMARNSFLHKNDMELTLAANAKNVQVEKFVLSDDKGHNYTAEVTNADTSSGDVTLNTERTRIGVTGVLPHATIYGKDIVSYSQAHPYYEATYQVRFPLFDDEGKARIAPDVKELTLHIITPNGEGVATYKLPTSK